MESSLLLDRNYTPISVVGWKKALRLLIRDKAEAVGDVTIKTVTSYAKDFSIPSIIKLKHPVSYNCFSGRIKFSRTNVILRDGSNCQYCGKHLSKNAGTIDHVLPRSRGGKTDYLNCVVCCKECNGRKGDRTPDEANMKLIKAPKRPNFIVLCRAQENLPEEWSVFLPGVYNK
jgi:hypothetical protein